MEWTFEVLKSRFCCISLSGGFLRYSPEKVGNRFSACCILHTLAHPAGLLLDIEVQDALYKAIFQGMHQFFVCTSYHVVYSVFSE